MARPCKHPWEAVTFAGVDAGHVLGCLQANMQVSRGKYLAHLDKSEGSKVLNRVRIWQDEKNNTHYELKRSDNVPYLHECIPFQEWNELRQSVIETLPSKPEVIDLLTVLSLAAELDCEPSESG